jgi:predicted O-methyltransferase YrrM
MNQETWTALDEYFESVTMDENARQEETLQRGREAGLPAWDVSPTQGHFLEIIARIAKAERVLEIGTLAGYSTTFLARAVTDGGLVVSLELNPDYAKVARENLAREGLAERVDIRVGDARKSLEQMRKRAEKPFDLVFIDADKTSTTSYVRQSLELAHAGSVIIVDNVVRGGKVLSGGTEDADGIRSFFSDEQIRERLQLTAIQTVGRKGYDGFAIGTVR